MSRGCASALVPNKGFLPLKRPLPINQSRRKTSFVTPMCHQPRKCALLFLPANTLATCHFRRLTMLGRRNVAAGRLHCPSRRAKEYIVAPYCCSSNRITEPTSDSFAKFHGPCALSLLPAAPCSKVTKIGDICRAVLIKTPRQLRRLLAQSAQQVQASTYERMHAAFALAIHSLPLIRSTVTPRCFIHLRPNPTPVTDLPSVFDRASGEKLGWPVVSFLSPNGERIRVVSCRVASRGRRLWMQPNRGQITDSHYRAKYHKRTSLYFTGGGPRGETDGPAKITRNWHRFARVLVRSARACASVGLE